MALPKSYTQTEFTHAELNGECRISLKRAAKWLGVSAQTIRNWIRRGHNIPYQMLGGQPRFNLPLLKEWQQDHSFNEWYGPDQGDVENMLETVPEDWAESDIAWFGSAYSVPLHKRMILELMLATHKGAPKAKINKLIQRIYDEFGNSPGLIINQCNKIIAMAEESPAPTPRPKPVKPKRGRKGAKPNAKASTEHVRRA